MNNHIAIVTGAGSGIGRATARRFAGENIKVIAIDRNGDSLRSLVAESGGNIEPFECDVTDHSALEKCVANALARHGRIDILINNAGYCYYERLTQSTLEHWRHTQAINIEAMYVLAKLVAPSMIEKRYGRI